jgi:signal transduction histidine kinase
VSARDEQGTADDLMAAFAAKVSHDLKNPLASVAMSLEMLDDVVGDDPDGRDFVERAGRGVQRMTALLDHLVEFASTGGPPARERVDLSEQLALVLEDCREVLAGSTVVAGPLPVVTGDGAQLRAVLHNLVDNAATYAGGGTAREVEVSARQTTAGHRVEVADRGPGVPDNERENVFQPLVRLDRTVKGAGLGLATCRRVVTAHGGRIGVEHRDGGGAVFWFELPDGPTTLG